MGGWLQMVLPKSEKVDVSYQFICKRAKGEVYNILVVNFLKKQCGTSKKEKMGKQIGTAGVYIIWGENLT